MHRPLALLLALACAAGAADPKSFRADFEADRPGSPPKGWTVTRTGEGKGSEWKIVEDKDAPKGPKALAQVAASPNLMFNLCVADGPTFRDVEVSVRWKAVKGKKDQGGGVVWRYVDARNYYVARYNPLEDNFRLYKIVEGKRIQLATKELVALPAGKWHGLSVRMKGDAISCSLDGKELLTAKDSAFAKAGKVGLWTKADAVTWFDDFRADEIGK